MKKHYYTKGFMDVTDYILISVSKHKKTLRKRDLYYYLKKARKKCLLKADELD